MDGRAVHQTMHELLATNLAHVGIPRNLNCSLWARRPTKQCPGLFALDGLSKGAMRSFEAFMLCISNNNGDAGRRTADGDSVSP